MRTAISKDVLRICLAIVIAAALLALGMTLPARAAEQPVPDANLRGALSTLLRDVTSWPSGTSASEFESRDSAGWQDTSKVSAALSLLTGSVTISDNAQTRAEAITNLTGLSYLTNASSIDLSGLGYLTTIHTGAFRNSAVKSVSLPVQLRTIQANAFDGCASLTAVILPEDSRLLVIGQEAFLNCPALSEFDFSHAPRLTACMSDAFSGNTALSAIDLSSCESLKTINTNAFRKMTGLKSISLPSGLSMIMQGAFSGCENLTTVSLPDEFSLATLSGGAFSGCAKLTAFDFSKATKLQRLGAGAFEGCKALTSVDLTACAALTSIDASAFYGVSGLVNLKLPKEITEIQSGAFENCTSLASVVFPKDSALLEIGAEAFRNCRALEEIDLTNCASLQNIGQGAFRGCSALVKVTIQKTTGVMPLAFMGSALSDLTLLGGSDVIVDESLAQADTFPTYFLKEENQSEINLGFELKQQSVSLENGTASPTATELKEKLITFTGGDGGVALTPELERNKIWVIRSSAGDRYLQGDLSKSLYIVSVFNKTAVSYLSPDKKAESTLDTSVPGDHTVIFLLADNPKKTLTAIVTVLNPGESLDGVETDPNDESGETGEPDEPGESDEPEEPEEPEDDTIGESEPEDTDNPEVTPDDDQPTVEPELSAFPKFGRVTVPAGQQTVAMRPDASNSNAPVMSLKEGMIIAVVGESGNWYMAQYGDYAGFVMKTSVADAQESEYSGTVTAPQQSDATEFPLMEQPDSAGEAIAMFAPGGKVTVTGIIDGWYEVTTETGSGYMQIIYVVIK